MKTTRLCRELLFGEIICVFESLPSSYCFYFFQFLLFIFSINHVIQVITPYSHDFLKEREYIYFKNFSVYKIKQNSTWRELFATQLALQSLTPRISNKSVCWETGNYAASLTVASESNSTNSPDLLVTQCHETSKNIQKSKHSLGTLLVLSFILVFFFLI